MYAIWSIHSVETRQDGGDGRKWSGTKWGNTDCGQGFGSPGSWQTQICISIPHFSAVFSLLYLTASWPFVPGYSRGPSFFSLASTWHFGYDLLHFIALPFFTFTSRPLDATSLVLPHPFLCATCSCLNSESLLSAEFLLPQPLAGCLCLQSFSLHRTLQEFMFSLEKEPKSLAWDARLCKYSFPPTISTKTHFLDPPHHL